MTVHRPVSTMSASGSRPQPAKHVVEGEELESDPLDFCNSFWGPGASAATVVFSRMRSGMRTTEQLREFWEERAQIEEEYAARLARLAQKTIGEDEIGELRNSLDTMMHETEEQAAAHELLCSQIRSELEAHTTQFLAKQKEHRKHKQTLMERNLKAKQAAESRVVKARERYEGDRLKIASYTQQMAITRGQELERLQGKLEHVQQTIKTNERDFEQYTRALGDLVPMWETDWKEFCDLCQDLEEERMDFMKDVLWNYANAVSALCVSDDQSCERVRVALDQFDPEKDVEDFARQFGTGNALPSAPTFVPSTGQGASSSSIIANPVRRTATFNRRSRRSTILASTIASTPSAHQRSFSRAMPHNRSDSVNADDGSSSSGSVQSRERPRIVTDAALLNASGNGNGKRESQPLPIPGPESAYPAPQVPELPMTRPPEHLGRRILFYVKALYDYTATTQEEFDFQAGDVIAVTETPDDGWWSGELLDEARREEGRNIFPSNFVCLF
ncbi:hypothetical protein EV122DRAFT_290452 [Schizophyllum commune]